MRTLIVAAGGGGDAITGSALTRILDLTEPPVVMTYSWDRLMIDPLPGPRTAADFSDLHRLAPHVLQVVAATKPVPPAGSSLPRLAAQLPARLLLLDPTHGAEGMAKQIDAAAGHFHATDVAIIDVGGDALTNGSDPSLRSPLADQLAIAACLVTGLPGRLIIAAPGIDGELKPTVVTARLTQMQAQRLPNLQADDLACVNGVFRWHPSEASGLLAAAVAGHRGLVEVRDAGDQIALTDRTTELHAVDLTALPGTLLARRLTDSRSLDEAERIVRKETGISEIRYETDKANRLAQQQPHTPSLEDLDTIDRETERAAARGSDYISMRRLSELLGSTTLDTFAALAALLAATRPRQYLTSIYKVA